jgi:hypothetical protein
MEGHSLKLADFFINIHLPVRSRNGWPLVCSGAQIAWIAGIRPAHSFRVTEQTRLVLHLTLERNRSHKNGKTG